MSGLLTAFLRAQGPAPIVVVVCSRGCQTARPAALDRSTVLRTRST